MQILAECQANDTAEVSDLLFGFLYSKVHQFILANRECWPKHVGWTPKHLQNLVLYLQVKIVFEKNCSRWFWP